MKRKCGRSYYVRPIILTDHSLPKNNDYQHVPKPESPLFHGTCFPKRQFQLETKRLDLRVSPHFLLRDKKKRKKELFPASSSGKGSIWHPCLWGHLKTKLLIRKISQLYFAYAKILFISRDTRVSKDLVVITKVVTLNIMLHKMKHKWEWIRGSAVMLLFNTFFVFFLEYIWN